MDTFAEYPKDGNVSALVAARVSANRQTTLDDFTRATSSSRKGKAKASAKGKGKVKSKLKLQMSSEAPDDSQESSANEMVMHIDDPDGGDLPKAILASTLPVKVGTSSRVSDDGRQIPATVASRDDAIGISVPVLKGQSHIPNSFELQDES